ncbi:MAG: DMT family transporter [Planctomycetota bacterium]|jgi:drug/metabolite transporter (DMT)-like permease
MKNANADLILMGVVVIWGLNFPVMKVAFEELHPFAFNAIRITVSTIFLGLLHLREKEQKRIPPGSWGKVLGLSMIGYFGYQVFFMAGLARTTAGSSSLLIASSPIWAALVGRMLGDRLTGRATSGLVLAFVGTSFIAAAGGEMDFSSETMLGNLLTIGAAMAWGLYTGLNRSLARAVSPISLAFYTTTITLPLHWAIGWPVMSDLSLVSPTVWGCIAFSGALGTGLAYAMWNVGIRQVGAAHTTIYVNLVPVLAIVISYFWLGEMVTGVQMAGGALVLGGLWLVRGRAADRS